MLLAVAYFLNHMTIGKCLTEVKRLEEKILTSIELTLKEKV